MRVVYLNCLQAPPDLTGEAVLAAWPTLAEVPAALSRAALEVDVVVAAGAEAMLRRDGVTYWFAPGGPGGVAEAVANCRPDVVHQQSFHFGRHTRALHERLPRVPVLVQDHGGRPPQGWRRVVAVWGARHIGGAAFTAREQSEPYLRSRVLRRGTPVFEILESSTNFTPGDQRAARVASGLYGDPCFLWVGRLDPNKDPLTVLAAFSSARRDLPDPQLWMCYTAAPLLPDVQRRLESDPELAGRVHLVGALPHYQIEVLCRAADFLVLGSHAEGSGYALLEALACGTAPLVTDIPSFRRITARGQVGALSTPGDVGGMAHAMVAWSRAERAELRRAARAHFERALSFSVVASELRAAYEALVAGP